MKTENETNASATGTTSTSAPDTALSEADYLKRQADEAKAAIGMALGDAFQSLGKGINPVPWIKEHPVATAGAVAAVGAVAAWVLIPSREQRMLRRLARIEAALHPNGREGHLPADDDIDSARRAARKGHSVMGMLGAQLISAAKPVLMSAISAAVAAATAKPDHEEMKEAMKDAHGEANMGE
jgi:hypothetical protein